MKLKQKFIASLRFLVACLVFILKRIPAWLAAVIATVILGVTFQTQNVISRLGNLGTDIGIGERLAMTGYDITHLGSLYGIFIAIALAIAFLASGLLFGFTKFGRNIIYPVAGGFAILVMLLLIKQAFFDVHIIAGARDSFGITLQILSGAMGGWVFAHLTRHLIKVTTSKEDESSDTEALDA